MPDSRLVPLPSAIHLGIVEYTPLRSAAERIGGSAPPVVLSLEGHMAQLINTPPSWARAVSMRGLRVVLVDNRDIGQSSRVRADYRIADMAQDVLDLVEYLRAWRPGDFAGPVVLVGRSMGGAIAQLAALARPDLVAGLGLFYTFAKSVRDAVPLPERPAPFDDEASFVAWELATIPPIAGSAYPFTAAQIRSLARDRWNRGLSWRGFERQRRAMGLQEPWADRLGQITVPVSIVHGLEDAVVPVENARRLAAALPGATPERTHLVPGLGHQQPAALDDLFVTATLEAAALA